MKTLRSLLFVIWLYGAMVLLGLAFAPFALFSRKSTYLAMRLFVRIVLFGLHWICGARVKFEGLEHAPKGGALVALKHQSMLDTLLPLLFLDEPAFVYKSELGKLPVFGWYLKRAHMFELDRGGYATALKAMMRAAREAVGEKRQFLIFPEGTRQELDAPPDYKPGVAALYKDLNVGCTPIALNTGLIWPAHGVTRHAGTATVRILPQIPPGLSRDDFMRELQARIESASQDLLPPHLRRTEAA
ncbi:MAG TPA: lysophospholipid acyltransferase family protein [Caulobacterales bacterium]|nr:lysophospholipid acyltransferase family protein [Caulobacterales bacterium]